MWRGKFLRRLVLFIALLSVMLLVLPRFTKTGNKQNVIFTKVNQDKESGFYHSYLLYKPKEITNKHLLVIPNNTGKVDDNIKTHEERAYALIDWRKEYADKLGSVLLVPIFPNLKVLATFIPIHLTEIV